ncbi:MAG: caspase family protein [Candidatus Krumholzibacteria bacterium]|nr:caspase family protein [Candidatus Krumholzibacteria bacterium]
MTACNSRTRLAGATTICFITLSFALFCTITPPVVDAQPQTRVLPTEVREAEGFDASQSVGIFIGIREFSDVEFDLVPYAVDDAVDLAHLFSLQLELVSPNRVILALRGDPQKQESRHRLQELLSAGAIQQSANQAEVIALLGDRPTKAGPKGLFVLTLATHGFSDQGADYLVAADSRRRRIARTGVKVDELFDDVSRATSPRRIVLIDACRERLLADTRSIADPNSRMGEAFVNAIANAKGMVVLSGSTLGGYSYDDRRSQNGVFSSAIIQGLQGEAMPNEDGLITVMDLSEYVNARVLQWISENRPKEAEVSKGIETRLTENAARMPLAVDPEARERVKVDRARREHLLTVLRENMGSGRITGSLVDEITDIAATSDPAVVEPLFSRLERLEELGSSYAEDFVAWWDQKGRTELTVSPPLTVTIEPEFKLLSVGQSQLFTIESNRPLDTEPLTWEIDPADLVDVREFSRSESARRIRVMAQKEGKTRLQIIDGAGSQQAEAMIDAILIRSPSPWYSVLGGTAAAALGVYALILNSQASDKLDDWNTCRLQTGQPCDDLGDEYTDTFNQARAFGIAAGAAGAATGYFFYRYYTQRKSYKNRMNMGSAQKTIDVEVGVKGVGLICRF